MTGANERGAKWIGIALGACLGLAIFVYFPMKRNYDQCGQVTLCGDKGTHVEG